MAPSLLSLVPSLQSVADKISSQSLPIQAIKYSSEEKLFDTNHMLRP